MGISLWVLLHNPPSVMLTINLWLRLVLILNRTLHCNGMSERAAETLAHES